MMECIDKLDKRIAENTQEIYGEMVGDFTKTVKKLMDEIKDLVVSELREVKTDIGEIRNEISKTESKVQDIEQRIQDLEKQLREMRQEKNLELKYEIKIKELQLRIRGLEEEEHEDIRGKVMKIVAELLERSPEEMGVSIDQVIRLKSKFAEREGVPRDVIVNITTKTLKEEILRQSFQNPIE